MDEVKDNLSRAIMHRRIVMQMKHERRMFALENGVTADQLNAIDKLINIIEAIPLTEAKP